MKSDLSLVIEFIVWYHHRQTAINATTDDIVFNEDRSELHILLSTLLHSPR